MRILNEHTQESNRLLIDTGLDPDKFARSALAKLTMEHGYIIETGGSVTPWIPEGTQTGPAGTLLICGPGFEGHTLADIVISKTPAEAWPVLVHCIAVLSGVIKTGTLETRCLDLLAGSGPETLVCGTDGRILLLPPELSGRSLAISTNDDLFIARDRYIHPDHEMMKPEQALAFMAASLAWYLLGGSWPFRGETAEELADSIRNGYRLPASLAFPSAPHSVHSALEQGLNTQDSDETGDEISNMDGLASLSRDYASIKPSMSETSDAELELIKRKLINKQEQHRKRRTFLRTNALALRIAAVCCAVAAAAAWLWITDLRGKPDVKGLSAEGVTRFFYNAYNRLDTDSMQAAFAKHGSAHINYASNLFVMSRVRTVYESEAGIITPEQLFSLKDPRNYDIFGFTRMTITQRRLTEDTAEFAVSYYQWWPSGSEGPDARYNQSVDIAYVEETVFLDFDGTRWKITAIATDRRDAVYSGMSDLMAGIRDGSALGLPWAPLSAEAVPEPVAPLFGNPGP